MCFYTSKTRAYKYRPPRVLAYEGENPESCQLGATTDRPRGAGAHVEKLFVIAAGGRLTGWRVTAVVAPLGDLVRTRPKRKNPRQFRDIWRIPDHPGGSALKRARDSARGEKIPSQIIRGVGVRVSSGHVRGKQWFLGLFSRQRHAVFPPLGGQEYLSLRS
jgi:hypothetical protein